MLILNMKKDNIIAYLQEKFDELDEGIEHLDTIIDAI